MQKIKDKIFKGLIWSFLVLYALVAMVSFYHCIDFCSVGNPTVISVIMSFAFEVGLALTLFSILISDENKNNIVSWILMTLLTIVQIMGNVYAVEKYMELSANNFYIYIQNGFLHWFTDDLPQRDIMSIIAIILGALLPVVALLMTSMVAKNWKLKMQEDEELEKSKEKLKEYQTPDTQVVKEEVFTETPMFKNTEQSENTEQEDEEETFPPIEQIPEEKEIQEEPTEEILNELFPIVDEEDEIVIPETEITPQKPIEEKIEIEDNSGDEKIEETEELVLGKDDKNNLSALIQKAKELAEEKNKIIDVTPERTIRNNRITAPPITFYKS